MASTRYPPIPVSEQPAEQAPYAQDLEEPVKALFGENGELITYRHSNGGLIGPFPILIASKEAGKQTLAAFKQLASLPSIPSDAKEIAILVTGTRFGARYELYAHTSIAIKTVGFSEEQVASVKRGVKPEGLSEAASVTFDATYHLANERGPLPSDLYEACVKVLGREGTLTMAHYVGMYCYMSVLMNLADAPVPEGES